MIFDGSLEFREGDERVTLLPFDLSLVGGAANSQLMHMRDLLPEASSPSERFPYTFTHMGQLLKAGREWQDLEKEGLRKAYEESQDLLLWGEDRERIDNLERADMITALQTAASTSSLAHKLCDLWMNELLPEIANDRFQKEIPRGWLYDFRGRGRSSYGRGLSGIDFFHWLGARYNPPFIFQTVYKIEKARFVSLQPPGRNFSISMGEGFSVGTSFSTSKNLGISASFSPMKLLPESTLGKVFDIGASAGVGWAWSTSRGNSLDFGTQTQIQAEESSLNLEFQLIAAVLRSA